MTTRITITILGWAWAAMRSMAIRVGEGSSGVPASSGAWARTVAAIAAGWVAGVGGADAAGPSADVRRDATVAAVEKVLPCVVNIGTLSVERTDPYDQMLREFFGYGRRAPDTLYSSGSGVIIDEEGWVLSNLHVVRGAAKVRVTVADESEPVEAEVVSVSEVNDLALLRLLPTKEDRKFKAVELAADDELLLGETVLALGNPYGLGGSVSRGILSSKTRRAGRDGESMEVEDWLQTDAAINPGNSGGPLVNLRGELIGLNVAVLAQAQGIGFAIPMKRISTALAEMFAPEATKGLWFGATLRGARAPVVVADVHAGGPADSAGLLAGDEVISVNGKPVRSILEAYRNLTESGREPKLVVQREGKRKEIRVRLVAEAKAFNPEYVKKRIGLTLERLAEDAARRLRLAPSTGWVVGAVEADGPAARAGLERGHIVTGVDGQAVGDLVAFGRWLSRKRAGESVTFEVVTTRRRGMVLQLVPGRAEVTLR